ncbi:MAG: 2-amino-4-hydroxy-6-hydroxymethyldihydropteridine diphosphokinase [Gammaproteobacteria bacterium]|nr:2-amino-4-hydroxy-6-hydroxymethyldihydropteridine diphosphokinase [Gammaproteobacteria bacterium]
MPINSVPERGIDIYIGIGSNIEDPISQVTRALDELRQLRKTAFLSRSALYRSPPMGPADQPDYINAVARLRTLLPPLKLLDELMEIERTHHRKRTEQRWGPRTLDLDILIYGDQQIDHTRLTVPHSGMQRRAFVLYPLQEINPDIHIPGRGPIGTLIAQCPRGDLIRVSGP